LLDDTLVVWSGEFGRTPMRENRSGVEMQFVGRDHNPGAFTLWMAGGGVKGGYSTARPTTSATSPSSTKCPSTTSTPRCSHLLWASITCASPIPSVRVNMRLTNVTKPGSEGGERA
jgi:hypothetical protein